MESFEITEKFKARVLKKKKNMGFLDEYKFGAEK